MLVLGLCKPTLSSLLFVLWINYWTGNMLTNWSTKVIFSPFQKKVMNGFVLDLSSLAVWCKSSLKVTVICSSGMRNECMVLGFFSTDTGYFIAISNMLLQSQWKVIRGSKATVTFTISYLGQVHDIKSPFCSVANINDFALQSSYYPMPLLFLQ